MWALKRYEPPPQPAEMWRGHMASALPPCFNADVALPRLLFLVSPTCEICVSGAMAAAHTVLSLPRVAWDLFLLYDAGSVWHEDPPVPALWMHQLFLEGVPKLEATVLRRHLERRMPAEQALPEAPETEER